MGGPGAGAGSVQHDVPGPGAGVRQHGGEVWPQRGAGHASGCLQQVGIGTWTKESSFSNCYIL